MITLPWNRKKSDFPIIRVDDRLLHGQVVVGWANTLGLELLVLANDRVAADRGMAAALKAGVSDEIRVEIVSMDDAATALTGGEYVEAKSMLVIESPGDALKLLHKGVALKKLHIGGLHFREGSDELVPYVFLSNWDRMALDEMVRRGVRISCQDLPSTAPVAYRG
ncbi:MAG: PTS sugar transporter subunit IIB [Calditrichaeota bacterium]|nr:PTS sugar transporter subunit IIB [Calditrichota bacterium]MCB9391533.1 PTS sugar transporter subunit IIB [Calditrichota bacterium]